MLLLLLLLLCASLSVVTDCSASATLVPLPLQWSSAANMLLIAFGVVVCALGEANLVMKGLAQQLIALLFEVG
jgi:hypothetical protein